MTITKRMQRIIEFNNCYKLYAFYNKGVFCITDQRGVLRKEPVGF
jgi:hypothetical protein